MLYSMVSSLLYSTRFYMLYSIHLETHTRSQTPHFMSYPMDMTWILQHQVYFLAKCHIHVISMLYLFFKKDIFGYTWYILN